MQNSNQLFHLIEMQLKDKISGFSVKPSKYRMVFKNEIKGFAHCYLGIKDCKLSFWCRGNADEIIEKHREKIKSLKDYPRKGFWGRKFRINFIIENENEITDVINLLIEISNSCSRKKEK